MTSIDLTEISGLPLALDMQSGRLGALTGQIIWEGPGVRPFRDLRSVVADPAAIDPIATDIAYFTYRDVRQSAETRLAERGLRYDITVTLPGTVGDEFIKTAGHYHGIAPDGVSWPEIYDVLAGEAAFVLQEASGDLTNDPEIIRGIVVVAFPGDRLVIPPGFGHVTVNIGTTPLAVADLVAIASINHYSAYTARQGGAVRVLAVAGEDDAFEAAWNPAYPDLDAGIEIIAATDLAQFEPDTPLYRLGIEHPGRVGFLTRPSSCQARL